MATINYENKEAISVNPTIPNKNKVVDSDMNLIKQVGNQILTTMGVYTDNWSSSATYNVDETAIYDNRIFRNLTGTNTETTPDQDTTNWEETTLASMSGGGGGGVTGDTLPIGSIVPYGSTTAPTNWLVCDGSAVSRTTYAELFAVIGTSFGVGDGSTTFNLPDLRKRVPAGYNSSDTDFNSIGKTGGEKKHTLTINEIPSHNHTTRDYGTAIGVTSANFILTTGGNGQNLTSGDTGGGQAHNNLQPYQVVCYIIKAKQSAGVVGNVSNTYSTSQSDTYSCDYINDNYRTNAQNDFIQIFSGSTAEGNASQINTTWAALGKFKYLIVELYKSGTNAKATCIMPYFMFSTGSDLNTNKINRNMFCIFILDTTTKYVHLIPNNNISANTIQFDSYGNDTVIDAIYVQY